MKTIITNTHKYEVKKVTTDWYVYSTNLTTNEITMAAFTTKKSAMHCLETWIKNLK